MDFHQLDPLGRVGLVVAVSVCMYVCLSFIFSRPFIGPQITLSDPVNPVWPQYPEIFLHLTIGPQINQLLSTHCGINTLKKCYT